MTDPVIRTPADDRPPIENGGRWRNHAGWLGPIWHDENGATVHLLDLVHHSIDEDVRRRAILALRRLIDPADRGPTDNEAPGHVP